MALWRAIVTLSFVLLLLFLISSVESKRKGSKGRKDDHKQVTLQELCRKSGQNSRKNILELQAFVDLSKVQLHFKVVENGLGFDYTVKRRFSNVHFWKELWVWHVSFLFAGFRMLEGRNMFKNSSLFCRGYARPQTRKSERLYSMESTLAWVAGNVAALKNFFFFRFCCYIGCAPGSRSFRVTSLRSCRNYDT